MQSGTGATADLSKELGDETYRRSDRQLTVSPFDSLALAQRTKVEKGTHLAKATDDDQPTVTWE